MTYDEIVRKIEEDAYSSQVPFSTEPNERRLYNDSVRDGNERLKADLTSMAKDYMTDAQSIAAFRLAYDDGHSGGDSEILYRFDDILDVFKAKED